MTARRRVAITGIGLVTPAGLDVASTWARIKAAKGCAGPITIFDASGFSTRIAAEVKGFDDLPPLDDRKLLKYASRAHRFAIGAADQAMADAGTLPDWIAQEMVTLYTSGMCLVAVSENQDHNTALC